MAVSHLMVDRRLWSGNVCLLGNDHEMLGNLVRNFEEAKSLKKIGLLFSNIVSGRKCLRDASWAVELYAS